MKGGRGEGEGTRTVSTNWSRKGGGREINLRRFGKKIDWYEWSNGKKRGEGKKKEERAVWRSKSQEVVGTSTTTYYMYLKGSTGLPTLLHSRVVN